MNAVIIYDEFKLAVDSKTSLEREGLREKEKSPWEVSPWRLDMLMRPLTGDRAFADASEAHVIVLAIRNLADLAPMLLDRLLGWLETWAAHRQFPAASLAIFNGGNGDQLSAAAIPELARFAERHGLGFILGDSGLSENRPTVADGNTLQPAF